MGNKQVARFEKNNRPMQKRWSTYLGQQTLWIHDLLVIGMILDMTSNFVLDLLDQKSNVVHSRIMVSKYPKVFISIQGTSC